MHLAEEDGPVERVPVPVIEHPDGGYDLITVFVRTHQVDAARESLAGVQGDVLFLLNWAAGPETPGAVIGHERVLRGFPTTGGTMDGDVVRYRRTGFITRRVAMPIGEPDGRTTPRLVRIVPDRAGPRTRRALADAPGAVRGRLHLMRQNLAAMETPPVPRALAALRALPQGLLVAVLRRFLRSPTAVHNGLDAPSPATAAELERLAEQLRAPAGAR